MRPSYLLSLMVRIFSGAAAPLALFFLGSLAIRGLFARGSLEAESGEGV